jgi:hypothetical protein
MTSCDTVSRPDSMRRQRQQQRRVARDECSERHATRVGTRRRPQHAVEQPLSQAGLGSGRVGDRDLDLAQRLERHVGVLGDDDDTALRLQRQRSSEHGDDVVGLATRAHEHATKRTFARPGVGGGGRRRSGDAGGGGRRGGGGGGGRRRPSSAAGRQTRGRAARRRRETALPAQAQSTRSGWS